MDKLLKDAFVAQSITFPSALGGMFIILGGLLVLETVLPKAVKLVFTVMRPGLDWIARWMPLFYVPSLVVLPLALQGVDPSSLYKILAITCVGFAASLSFTAGAGLAIRKVFGGAEPAPAPSAAAAGKKADDADADDDDNVFTNPPPPATQATVLTGWAVVWCASLFASRWLTMSQVAAPFMLASVVGSFLIGTTLPAAAKKIVHPLITCFLLSDASAVVLATVYQSNWQTTLGAFLTRGVGAAGAGDMLMKFLGCVVLSFGFRIYEQRKLVKRHAVEILGTMLSSAFFSLAVTLLVGRAMGLDSELTRSVAPRCVTVALALPVASQLGAAAMAPITAVTVVLTGLLGANFAQTMLDKMGIKDPITRGLATAGSSHGLGTAALASNEPDSVPFAALAYASMGIFANLLVSVPAVRVALMGLAG